MDWAPVSQRIWDMKYRFRDPSGAADADLQATWRRVARALAAAEREPGLWVDRFEEALSGFKFLPAGRVIAGAGTGRTVTLFNCFVMGTIPDDMSGIFENVREAALTMQQGGGIGHDFSTLRPLGAPVKGVGADASGPLSFMDVWDAMCRTIMSAGSRRGAMMATLRCDHPDVEAFVEAKRDPSRLRMFNVSVLVTDAFMQAVKDDADWDLVFAGKVYKTVKARGLWERIMRATYDCAEPGVIFIDRVNRRNNLHYCETIQATNPCITAETWIHTAEGPQQVRDLIGRPFAARVDGRDYPSSSAGFFATGTRRVRRLRTRAGYSLRLTDDHPVLKVTRLTRWSRDAEWVAAGDLRPGDQIVLHDHRDAPHWEGHHDEAEGYLIGLLLGDGTLKDDKAVISVWRSAATANGMPADPGVNGIMEAALAAARALPHRADFAGWVEVKGRDEWRLSLGAVRKLAGTLGLAPGCKTITPAMERTSSDFHRGLLRGLFDTDGSVQGTQAKGVSVRLSQNDLGTLEAVQRMLLRLGIASVVYRERRAAGRRPISDGKGGLRLYECAAQHELVIAGDGVRLFAERVGFADRDKMLRLRGLLTAYRRALNRERFIAEVESIEAEGVAEVYDAQIPGINAFDANGLYAHNCGEQPLPPYGACLLGSINLAVLVKEPFTPQARLDLEALERLVPVAVRMLDNVIDVSRFPLPQQEKEAKAKRRIGLGVTGLADALIFCGVRYGSKRAIELAREWLAAVQRLSYLASADLAAEKGSFPLFDRARYLAGETIGGLPEEVCSAIGRYGIRNALLNSIAPTGTISLLADNVSSGIEPVFAFRHVRHVLQPNGSRREESVEDHAWRRWRALKGEAEPPADIFVDAQTLSPGDHLAMQAAAQDFVDSSISKTINLPRDISFEAFKHVYEEAYAQGCKGCTTYRPNEVTGAVLEVQPAAGPVRAVAAAAAHDGEVVYIAQPLARPEDLPGKTYKIKWPGSDHAIYITINDVMQDGRRRPFEIFINSKNMEHYAWTVALTRMISAVFRRGGDVSFVVEELKAVFDPRGGQWMEGRYVPSLLAAIGGVIERHLIEIGFLSAADPSRPAEALEHRLALASGVREPVEGSAGASSPRLGQCPNCGAAALTHQEGCDICLNCGYSRCG
ncbi:LAGLIDADG family homing endonuclease [Enhydrobacter sp.]|uniref:LAGLIDADG family homing endonuclease n=1 Tax=Enhydrobacter sp. TaxID=1894999 RepID=UPI0026304D4D|nr:LAGLIDADG family homing endonuclease [Enhydrobacter sp.]WIM14322.1 MAG: Ribonucleotide reductase of class II (coenzyme B12-dependent) [Enhydrobacter sp.]